MILKKISDYRKSNSHNSSVSIFNEFRQRSADLGFRIVLTSPIEEAATYFCYVGYEGVLKDPYHYRFFYIKQIDEQKVTVKDLQSILYSNFDNSTILGA